MNSRSQCVIMGAQPSDVSFVNMNVHDCGSDIKDHGMYISGIRTRVIGGEFHHNFGHGLHLYHGMNVDHPECDNFGEDMVVVGADMHDNTVGGTCGTGILGCTIINSVAHHNISQGWTMRGGPGTQHTVLNNTFWANGKTALSIVSSTLGQATIQNNIYTSFTQPSSMTNVVMSHNLEGGDPRFVDEANGDFHLLPDSPAVDAGLILPEVEFDFDGTPHGLGNGYDIGAYEYIPPKPEQLLSSAAAVVLDSANFKLNQPSSKLFDGLVGSTESHKAAAAKHVIWVILDLGDVHQLTRARLFGDADGTYKSAVWSLSISDAVDGPWTEVFVDRPSLGNQWFEEPLGDLSARFVLVEITGSGTFGYVEARELEIYGR
jgi:hypothetical protein